MNNLDNLFPGVIGQQKIKNKINFYLSSYRQNGIFPNALLTAPKGEGKTFLSRTISLCLNLPKSKKPKTFLKLNSSTIRSASHFFESIAIPYLQNNAHATILFDECSELCPSLTMALLSVLEPNKEHKNIYNYNNNFLEFDFRKLTFLFCTNEPQRLNLALSDRLVKFSLQPYSLDDLKKIIEANLDGIKVEKGVMDSVGIYCRGNARHSKMLGDTIKNHLDAQGRKTFAIQDWDYIRENLSLYPGGMSETEVEIMQVLKRRGESSLSCLAATIGTSTQSLQRSGETLLLKNGYIRIQAKGRVLTGDGLNYLNRLET